MDSLFCDKCNKKLDFVYVDGYFFGDRLMEGVLFKVKMTNDKSDCFGVHSEAEIYMEQFNWGYWKTQCDDFCFNLDIALCPFCQDEVCVE